MRTQEKIPYPKIVWIIIFTEFCERYSFFGLRTILILYFTQILHLTDRQAKMAFHTFSMLTFTFPLVGAILSDSYLGMFNTIIIMAAIFSGGTLLLSGAAAEIFEKGHHSTSIVALVIIAVGTGGLKPCISTFGGDQFVLPQQSNELERFFHTFYFIINLANLLSTFITPIMRRHVHCFGESNCFPLAFLIPGLLCLAATVLFICGNRWFLIRKPQENKVWLVTKCAAVAVKKKIISKEKKEHWLDYAESDFDKHLISHAKITFQVLRIFIPMPVFWMLADQKGSGWTLQASKMDGQVGIHHILPDQMQLADPILLLLFIPMFTYYIYPYLSKYNLLDTALQRMICGGILAALAFIISTCLADVVESALPDVPKEGNVHLRVYNPRHCDLIFSAPKLGLVNITVEIMSHYENKMVNLSKEDTIRFSFASICQNVAPLDVPMKGKSAYGVYVMQKGARFFEEQILREEDGRPKVRTLAFNSNLTLSYTMQHFREYEFKVGADDYDLHYVPFPGLYELIRKRNRQYFWLKLGGIYSFMVYSTGDNLVLDIQEVVVTTPNSISVLWMLPQYIIISLAQILFSITGLIFSYSQAPQSMKSIITACFLLTSAAGNAIDVGIAYFLHQESTEMCAFATLMLLDILLLTFLAKKYDYVEAHHTADVPELITTIGELNE